jgi:hypothetical protein
LPPDPGLYIGSGAGRGKGVMGVSQTEELIDVLIWRFRNCRERDECRVAFREIVEYLADNWTYLIGWSQFEAWGKYFVSPDKRRCVYIALNPRLDPPVRVVEEVKFSNPTDLANKIWLDQKGVIPFKKIAEAIKAVFGVDVEMSEENKWIRVLFGEAGDC